MLEDNKYSANYIESLIKQKRYVSLKTPIEYISIYDDDDDNNLNFKEKSVEKNNDFKQQNLYRAEIENMIDRLAEESKLRSLTENKTSSLHIHVLENYPVSKAYSEITSTNTNTDKVRLHQVSDGMTDASLSSSLSESQPPAKKRKTSLYSSIEQKQIEYAYLQHQQLHMEKVLENHVVSKQLVLKYQAQLQDSRFLQDSIDRNNNNLESLAKYQLNQIKTNQPLIDKLQIDWKTQLISNIYKDAEEL